MGLRRRYLPHSHSSLWTLHRERVAMALQLRRVESHTRLGLRLGIEDLLHVRYDQRRWNGDFLAVSTFESNKIDGGLTQVPTSIG